MPARRMLTMRQLRRILRLHHEGSSRREIVRAAFVARSTVQDALKRAAAAKLSWPLPDGLTDEELEAQLFAKSGSSYGSGVRKRPEPDWAELLRELRRPAVTMVILWEEYRKSDLTDTRTAGLRAFASVSAAVVAGHASASCRRRQAVCRLPHRSCWREPPETTRSCT
jgi:hypothetical protein